MTTTYFYYKLIKVALTVNTNLILMVDRDSDIINISGQYAINVNELQIK